MNKTKRFILQVIGILGGALWFYGVYLQISWWWSWEENPLRGVQTGMEIGFLENILLPLRMLKCIFYVEWWESIIMCGIGYFVHERIDFITRQNKDTENVG